MPGLCNSKILRRKKLSEVLGVSEVTIWRWERKGLLPAKRQIGPNAVGWLESDIEAWWAAKTAAEPESSEQG